MQGLTRILRTSALVAVLITLVGVFAYAALRSGPLAPIQVTVITIENRPISPGLFGIGTLEARYTYRIGPAIAGRVERVGVQVGDLVKAGALLGEMDPVDLDARIQAQEAALARADEPKRISRISRPPRPTPKSRPAAMSNSFWNR
jgi:HlyD family secretion protein